ncbi:N-acetylmuramoyl-L-alanine amidase [Fulvimarina endophytica]|uniref:N-acetylmuramoyl-L-alanine amidase n=1 Tax=Fulvimarina endophytica TaxID=2293836 RepID=A0A371WZB9_9HYPH|nr:transporter substrate-binding protein [Fulvimarina endophytica]RFC62276.1 N-acetylmuramoyl-L-alanine amidase [Fulvimarina endophytica]
MKTRIDIGILFSRSGPYRLLAEASYRGAMDAIAAINADPERRIEIVGIVRDPAGNTDRYASLCADILATSSARHIVGCTTSWSRKEVIPNLEKAGGTLWYACPYEGFEASEHVVYLHACPNQHLVPLLAHVLPRFGSRAFFVGSNYIWGWETNRVARDVVGDVGGTVLGERYLPLGDTDVARLIEEIRATRPNFILNNLIGPSSYAFFRAYGDLCRSDPAFSPRTCPILSCNLTEIELPEIGPSANGHLSVGPWFAASTTDAAPSPSASSFYAAAHSAVSVLADRLTDEIRGGAGAMAFSDRTFKTRLGPIRIDPNTHHTSLPVRIARAQDGRFEVIEAEDGLVAPDPYLSRYDPARLMGRRTLRVVS